MKYIILLCNVMKPPEIHLKIENLMNYEMKYTLKIK